MIEKTMAERSAPATVEACKTELAARGWVILGPHLLRDGARATLSQFGTIIPQFNDQETFEVTLKDGFASLPYSQSTNAIGPHTEAPVYDPPPRYLALDCHRQARCGGGQTLLADGFDFYESLSVELKTWARDSWIDFTADAQPGSSQRRTHRARLVSQDGGATVFRFSYNQFRYGNVNPSEADIESATAREDDAPLSRIARRGEAFFYEKVIPVLIPDGSLLIWDNHRLMHARSQYSDSSRRLTRYWLR
jgi:alpha-ketoglutarate-dependent taurine dioxygenase